MSNQKFFKIILTIKLLRSFESNQLSSPGKTLMINFSRPEMVNHYKIYDIYYFHKFAND